MSTTGSHVHLQQCSSRARATRCVSCNVTSNRSRSAKTLVGTGQINPPASSGCTEQHAPSSGPQCRATLPTVSNAAPSADFGYKSPGHRNAVSRLRLQVARCLRNQPPTSNIKKIHFRAPHNASCVFTEHVNKRRIPSTPSINCGPSAHTYEFRKEVELFLTDKKSGRSHYWDKKWVTKLAYPSNVSFLYIFFYTCVCLAIPSLQLRLTTSLFSNLDSKLKTNSQYLSIDQCRVLVLICSHILLRSCLAQIPLALCSALSSDHYAH
jgi:hypothetical protein